MTDWITEFTAQFEALSVGHTTTQHAGAFDEFLIPIPLVLVYQFPWDFQGKMGK